MLMCGYVGMLECGYVGMLVCGYAGMLVCGYVSMLVCGYVGMLVCGYAGMLVCGYAVMLVCGHAGMRLCGHADMRPYAGMPVCFWPRAVECWMLLSFAVYHSTLVSFAVSHSSAGMPWGGPHPLTRHTRSRFLGVTLTTLPPTPLPAPPTPPPPPVSPLVVRLGLPGPRNGPRPGWRAAAAGPRGAARIQRPQRLPTRALTTSTLGE